MSTTKKESKEPQGLEADAKKAKEQYGKVDEATAAQHEELRETGKIVPPTAALGYEQARSNMYLEPEDKVQPETPKAVEPTPSPSQVTGTDSDKA
jgi:hypothetical protein